MKVIYVVSNNGLMARGPDDNMSWTPKLDKQIFRLLTTFDEWCVCSKRTYELLSRKMLADPARKFIVAEKIGENSLVELNRRNPNIILIGGPTILKVAYDLKILDTIVVNTTKTNISGDPKYRDPLADVLKNPISKIDFGDFVTMVYKMQHSPQK